MDVYKELIEVIVKMQKKCKKRGGGSGREGFRSGGVRVDVYKELIEVIVKKQKKVGGRGVAGFRSGVGRGGGAARFGVVGDMVYGGCQPRIECIDKCK